MEKNYLKFLLPLFVVLLTVNGSFAAPKKAPATPTFSVVYTGGGRIVLDSSVREPNAGNCNVTFSTKNASLENISWKTVWKNVPLSQSTGRSAKSSKIEGRAKNDATNIYDLSGCRGGYTFNNCVAPSACEVDAGSCQANDLYQTPGYPVQMTVKPDKKKKGRWIVTIAAEGAAFSPCAAGVINNSFFEDSPTTARFYLTAAQASKSTTLPLNLKAEQLDCSEAVLGLEYTCGLSFYFSTEIQVTGKVIATPFK